MGRLKPSAHPDYLFGKTDDFSEFLIWPAVFLGMLLLMKITDCIYKVVAEKYESIVVFESEKKIISKLSSISYENYETNDFYEKVNLARQASGQYSQAIYGITQLVNIVIMVITYGVLLSKINMLYVLIIFVCIAVSIFMASGTTEKQLNFWRVHVSPDERRCSYFMGTFANRVNHQNIQTNRAFSYFGRNYGLYNSRARKNYLKLNFFSFSTELFTSLMFLGSYLLAALLVGNGVVTGKFEIGYFSMVVALLSNMFVTLKRFAMFVLNKNWYVKVLDAYYDILSLSSETRKTEISQNVLIEMDNLTYRYSQAKNDALNGITASFGNGSKIAVVGENGSGKTTMVSIILGLLQNYGGDFRWAGIDKTAILQDFVQ